MKRILSFCAAGLLMLGLAGCRQEPAPCGPIPTEDQLHWQEMEMYAFIHYSLNTYTGEEWGYGNEDLQLFNPSDLDCRQWARVCKQAGMKGIIFTAKHHCGFCMWPSQYTEYSVKNTPWKDGKGDVVRELADACREEGLKFAVYLSPWDRNHADYGKPEYVTCFRNQLRELLTGYGDIFEVWFDGANGGNGWYGGADETRTIDRTTYYQWPETYRMVRELQPHAVIWNDGGDRGDLRWVGTEAGNVGETNWSLLNHDGEVTWPMLHYGLEDGDTWVPGETNTSIRPGWFYHEEENGQVKSLQQLMDTYYKSVGRNSCLLLNFPVAPNGRIHPVDSLRGLAFNKVVQDAFKEDLARKARIKTKGNETVINFRKEVTFNRFVAEEDIRYGQRVKKFSLEANVDGQWVPLQDQLAENGDGLTTIGYRRIICFPAVTATQLRFTVLESKCEPVIKKTGVYFAQEPVTFTAQEDHRNMMDQLGIQSIRRGFDADVNSPFAANYDESKANPYPVLPEILRTEDGTKVTTPREWWDVRRPEIVEGFEREVYGRVPDNVPAVTWTVEAEETAMVGATLAKAKKLRGHVDNSACPYIDVDIKMVVVTPAEAEKPVPLLMMFGFPLLPSEPNPFAEFLRRMQGPSQDPPSQEQLLAAGWGYATIDPGSIQADNGAGLTRGIIGLVNKGQPRKPEDWGSLRAWAWGAARGLDYLETAPDVDAKHVGIEGVSRYGKAALVTLAFEERFFMGLIGSSGKGGAALHRRVFGEGIENLAGEGEYHWMAGNYIKYSAIESATGAWNADMLPVDSHELIALCAPRLVFISYGIPEQGDALWLDQYGSWQATVAAGEVYKLLGAKDLGISNDYRNEPMPPVLTGLMDGQLAWRQHDGGHTDAPNMKYFIAWASGFID